MKFLLFPNFRHAFEQRILDGIASSLRKAGHTVNVAWRPADDVLVAKLVAELNADVVFRVNAGRPVSEYIPKHVRFITWFQDMRKNTVEAVCKTACSDDLVYYMAPPEALLGCKIEFPVQNHLLAPAVDSRIITSDFNHNNSNQLLDMCMVNHMMEANHARVEEDPLLVEKNDLLSYLRFRFRTDAANLHIFQKALKIYAYAKQWKFRKDGIKAKIISELHFTPLSAKSAHEDLHHLLERVGGDELSSFWKSERFYINYLRLIERVSVARYMIDVSRNVKFFGNGWGEHDEFAKYAGGHLWHTAEMIDVFRDSKLTIHLNTDGCNMHDRVIYAMASGSMILTPKSDWDNVEGGFGAYFEKNKHFANYDSGDFHETCRYWLKNDAKRADVTKNAFAEILKSHTYENRVNSILTDLAK